MADAALRRYRRRSGTPIVAVRLDLKTEGFTYQKWGGTQRCKAGDWLVQSAGETYTVDGDVFERTYKQVSPGVYEKFGTVWAQSAASPGSLPTREGDTNYDAGDMLVFNDAEQTDGWAVPRDRFDQLYELDAEERTPHA